MSSVSGAAHGLGFAVLHRLLAQGALVAVQDMDDVEMTRATTAFEISRSLIACTCDQFVWADIHLVAAVAKAAFGWINTLANNANLAGPAAPGMIAQDFGCIALASSGPAKRATPTPPPIPQPKLQRAMTESFGNELTGLDNWVDALTLSPAKTRSLERLMADQVAYMLGKVPRGRLVAVGRAAAMVAFMVSDQNSFTTGVTFDLSGERTTY